MDKCFELLHKGKIEEALSAFESMDQKSKHSFFSALQTYVSSPKTLSLLVRRLKEDASYEDFYQAWLPPIQGTGPEEGSSLGYFKAPVKVLNFQSLDDSSKLLSLGFMWIAPDELEQTFSAFAATEKERHDSIDRVAEKIGPTQIYVCKDISDLGT